MALITARDDSNAAEAGADHSAESGEAMKVGFSAVAMPKGTGAARSNSDVPSTSDSIGSLGNDGTSVGAYKAQPREINSKDPQLPKDQPK